MDQFNYNVPVGGYGQLRYNPQMPGLAQIGQGPQGINPGYLPYNAMPLINSSVNSNQPALQMHGQRELGNIDYSHIMQSQELQGMGAYLRGLNQRKDFLSYNRTQSNPLKMIPQNPNTSQQSLYGEQGMKKGGKVRMDLGGGEGGGPEINTKNMIKSDLSGRGDVKRIDLINSVLSGRNSSIYGYGDNQDKLMMQAYLWRKQSQGQSPEQMIQGFYNKPVDQNNPIDVQRQNLRSIGYGPNAMYNNTPNEGVRAFAEGGRFDDFDSFDEDDFEDLKDELDRYFKEGKEPPAALQEKEDQMQDKEDKEPEQQEQPNTHNAINFLNNISNNPDISDIEDDDKTEDGKYVTAAPIDLRTPIPQHSSPVNGSAMPDMSDHPLLQSFKKGIANVENAAYTEGNKNSTAFGKYQFTAPTLEAVREMQFSNIPKKDFVDTYKSDPQFQERVMDAYSAHLLQKYPDPHQAATAFYLGEGKANYYNQPNYNPGHGNVSVGKYLSTFDQGYNKRQGGHIMNKPQGMMLPFEPQMKMKEGGEYDLTELQIQQLEKQGYKIQRL